MIEGWVRIFGFPRYLVSNTGEIKDTRTNRLLTQSKNQHGIMSVGLVQNGLLYRKSVPLLVARHWLSAPEEEHYNTPIHLTGEKSNCNVENLMWRPRHFAVRYHLEKSKPLDEVFPIFCFETHETFDSVRDASIYYGMLEADIFRSLQEHTPVWPDHVTFIKY